MSNYLCFDLGTTKIKSSLIDENGDIIYFSVNDAITYFDNGIYQKPEEYYKTIVNEINIIKVKHPKAFRMTEVLICSGQMGGILGIDENWDVVFPWSYSIDNRFNSYMNKIEKNMDKLIRKLSGGYPFGPGKMLWIKNDFPGFYKRIRKFINLTTYVAGKLCKLNSDKAFIDKSCLTFFGLADVVKGKWNMDVCIQLGISIEKLPKICRPFEIIGNINRSIFGTEKDINVMVGCGDQVAGFLGSGIINNNNIVDVTGTYTVLGHCTKEFKSDLKNKVFSVIDSGIDDIFYQIAVIAAGGYTYRWFIEKFNYKPALNFENYKGTKGLYFIPYIGGRYHPVQPYYDGTWLGINWDHVLDDFYVSLLESFGYEFRFYLNLLKEISGSAGIDFKDIKVIGGGAKNNLWNNIKANILNLKYQRLNSLPFEIIGIFLIAKYGNNLKSGFQKLINDKIIFTDEIIEPIKEKILFYERNMENYIKIINGLDKVYSSIKS